MTTAGFFAICSCPGGTVSETSGCLVHTPAGHSFTWTDADEDRRRRWHAMDSDHDQPFEKCASSICQGDMPVPS